MLSLGNDAFQWFMSLPNASIKRFDDLTKVFIGRYKLHVQQVTPLNMCKLKQREGWPVNNFIKGWNKVVNLVQLPNNEKKCVLFCALLPSCINNLSTFEDLSYGDIIAKMVKNEALHESFNQPLDHMKTKLVLILSF